MSSIKPPGPLPGVPLAREATATDAAGTASAAPEATASARPAATAGAAPAAIPDAVGEIARAVAEGALSIDAAVERLVERAVGPIASRLSEAERDELAALLRDALAHDPALGSLRESVR